MARDVDLREIAMENPHTLSAGLDDTYVDPGTNHLASALASPLVSSGGQPATDVVSNESTA